MTLCRALFPPTLLLALLGTGPAPGAAAATAPQNAISPGRVEEIARWLPAQPAGAGVPAAQRQAWAPLLRDKEGIRVVNAAIRMSRGVVPDLTDAIYLDFSKTGNRDRGQAVISRRSSQLGVLALAECLENRGQFLGALTNTIGSMALEKTWVLPAHDRSLANFQGKAMEADLQATLRAWELATVDYLLGDRLPAGTRELIRREVRRRVLAPFRESVTTGQRRPSWLTATHNWNAVCLAGVTGAALALEPAAKDRAWYVAAAEEYTKNFLAGFTADGYCSEGLGYWNYGFGRYVMLAEMVRQATGGRLDLLVRPEARGPALFAARSEIINGVYPSLADCSPDSRPDRQIMAYLGRRFDLPGAAPAPRDLGGGLAPTVLFTFLPEPLPAAARAELPADQAWRTWFDQGGVLICRPGPGGAPFAATLKGGHNAEHHNHNDLGSFSVVSGRTSVLCDPGAEVYTARTFSSKRYDSQVLSSHGHSVPVVAGRLQSPGAQARATVINTAFSPEQDTLALDLKSAYAVPELTRLERTFVFTRGTNASLRVTDRVAFTAPQTFETALISWGTARRLGPDEFMVTDGPASVRVRIDTGGRPYKVNSQIIEENVRTRTKPNRIRFALEQPVDEAVITLEIRPAE